MMVTREMAKEMASKAGLENWLVEGTAERGWYTCTITGKKMRGAAAEEQLAKQAGVTGSGEQAACEEQVAAPAEATEAPADEQAADEQPTPASKLTLLETRVLRAIGDELNQNGWREEGFSCLDVKDLAAMTGLGLPVVKGVLGSLLVKDLINTAEHESGDYKGSLIYMQSEDWTNPGTGKGWAVYDGLPEATDEESVAGNQGDKSDVDMSDRLYVHLAVKQEPTKLVDIDCVDCGTRRRIKPQDAFQVKRCVDCQKKHRNAIRAGKRKVKRQAAKVEQQEQPAE